MTDVSSRWGAPRAAPVLVELVVGLHVGEERLPLVFFN
jgi:hypothetical protein